VKFKLLSSGADVTLTKKNFITAGGEGSIYAKGGKCYKIYTDPAKMIPAGKIQELAAITNPNVIKPEDILLSGKKPVGYSMRHVKDNYILCQLFTKAFKQRSKLTNDKILEVIRNLQQNVTDIHNAGILVVDLNELNILVSKNFKEVYPIDVDSYQTRHYPATAIMDSIKDWHVKANKWTEESDWFSWGVIIFQLMTGIHPFKGNHPSIKGMVDRMKANISVLRSEVTVPKMVQLSAIPEVYKNWFKAIFDDGKRLKPPIGPVEAVAVHVIPIGQPKLFEILEIDNLPQIELISEIINTYSKQNLMIYKDRIYVKAGDQIIEYQNKTFSGSPLPVGPVASILPQATKLYDGIAIQDMLGTWYGNVFPESGKSYQIQLSDLTSYKIVDAKYDNRVLIIIGSKNGKYDKFIYRFERFGAAAEVKPELFWKSEDRYQLYCARHWCLRSHRREGRLTPLRRIT
jgi:serine/threonine protein kinase